MSTWQCGLATIGLVRQMICVVQIASQAPQVGRGILLVASSRPPVRLCGENRIHPGDVKPRHFESVIDRRADRGFVQEICEIVIVSLFAMTRPSEEHVENFQRQAPCFFELTWI